MACITKRLLGFDEGTPRGVTLRSAISAEWDKYLKHHGGFGGTSWVYLNRTATRIAPQPSSENFQEFEVLTGPKLRDACLMPAASEAGCLGNSHGVRQPDSGCGVTRGIPEPRGLDEARVPLVIYNAAQAPGAGFFQSNIDLAMAVRLAMRAAIAARNTLSREVPCPT
jgi:phosphonoacetate hydrolase